MRKSRVVTLSAFLAIGAISLPLLASIASAVAASPRSTPPIGRPLAKLAGSDTVIDDEFGNSVSISGTTAVVGAPAHANFAGRAYVFTETATGWKQTAELKSSDTVRGDNFGTSVAISGTRIVVGAYRQALTVGAAYVFTKTGAGWKQVAELKGSDIANDFFGVSAAISGTTALVGAYANADGDGAEYVFTKTATSWKKAELQGSDTVGGSTFGGSAAISGTTAIVGAPNYNNVGAAYVFSKTGAGWMRAAEVKSSDLAGYDSFGGSVAISGATAIVGAPGHALNAGRAYVFTETGAGWKQTAELNASDAGGGDDFGNSVAISGTTAVLGASGYFDTAGRVYVFTKTATGWKQSAELKGFDTVGNDAFGGAVAISGATAIVGAPGHAHAGAAYVFTETGAGWKQVAELKGSDTGVGYVGPS